MTPLVREAVRISQDIGDATFVGAVAVALHTGEQRQSQDLDFVVAQQMTNEELLKRGYTVDPQSGKKFTPRGYKIDIYDKRDLNGINLKYIVETAVAITVDGNTTAVNAISLEGLAVAKFRAARDQDIEDLRRLAVRCGSKIDWNAVRDLAKSDTEYSQLKQAIRLYATR